MKISPAQPQQPSTLAGSNSAAPEGPMRWDGWGDPALAKELPFALRALLPMKLGRLRKPSSAVPLTEVRVQPSLLSDEDRVALSEVIGHPHVALDTESRLRHAGGKSTPDLLRRRLQEQKTPDAVVAPADHGEVLEVLRVCRERGIAVVPFGGGTSVVGGLDPERGMHRAVIALTLRRLSGLVELDEVSGEARFLAGTAGPEAELLLAERGFELGHYPQSFLYATLGGFASARSSGQNSAGNGRFDSMVLGMKVATPTGEATFGVAPGSSAGPDLTRLMLGSEGIFGVITELVLRVHPTPEVRAGEGWTFPNFAAGVEALKQVAMLGSGAGPTVIRLSDEAETSVSLAQHGSIGKALTKGCSAVTVYEGTPEAVRAKQKHVSRVFTKAGGTSGESEAADAWLRGRFSAPYLRDALLDQGVLLETLETATTWANLHRLRQEVTTALEEAFVSHGGKCLVLCHISHIYQTGAALYFTVAGNVRGEQLASWERIKASCTEVIVRAGGTISHHHGVGRDHAPWLPKEIGGMGMRILRAVKAELDPTGIMNPGALLPARDGAADG